MPINFPDNPTDNQEFNGYIYDATRGVWDVKLASDPLGSINLTTPAQGEVLSFDGTNWVNQEIVTNPYSSATNATDFFAIPKGTDAERPATPQDGYIRFNSTSGEPEWYSANLGEWFSFREQPTLDVVLEYLVIAGGGGGGSDSGGGAGAGGYRSSISGESSGGGALAESTINATVGVGYSVTVGAGGSGGTSSNAGSNGSNSVFSSITSTGGGGGGGFSDGLSGGSGGGGGWSGAAPRAKGLGTANQGFDGGDNLVSSTRGAGGGGASSVGLSGSSTTGGTGGSGVTSAVTGVAIARAGGGGGGGPVGGSATDGGGPGGSETTNGTPGTPNTGGGGGASRTTSLSTGSGGSGIVIIKYPSKFTATVSAGLSSVTNTIGDYKVTQFTAGTGTVTFS